MTLPKMTKGKHWAWVGASYIASPVLAFIAFTTVPMLGLFIIPIPAVLTIGGVILYLKNTTHRDKC
jgi:small neutral amino acid transporter SnatA (MarC family)